MNEQDKARDFLVGRRHTQTYDRLRQVKRTHTVKPRTTYGARERANHNPKVSVTFPQELFDAIEARATTSRRPFGAVVRELCCKALEESEE